MNELDGFYVWAVWILDASEPFFPVGATVATSIRPGVWLEHLHRLPTHGLIALPWFRVHAIVLNDPGRLLAVHLMHTGLVAGWAGSMTFYELSAFDPTDLTFNPMWRQGLYVLPMASRLGATGSWSVWSCDWASVPSTGPSIQAYG